MEKLEVVGFLSGTEGGSVDPKRNLGHEVKKKPKEVEMELDDDVLEEESVTIQCPKRKVFRVESEETQDYARETLAISQTEGPFIGATFDVVKKPSVTGR